MSHITLTKEAAVAVRDALAALIDNEKQAQTKTAADKTAAEKLAADNKVAVTKIADHMLAKGLITKEGYDRTVENLLQPKSAMPYLKKALDMLDEATKAAKTAAAAEEAAPRTVGRAAGKTPVQKVASSQERLDEAGRAFDRAIGL